MRARNQRTRRTLKVEQYLRRSASEMEARLNEGQTLAELASASPHIHASTRSRAANGNACSPLVRHAMLLLAKRRCGATRDELLESVQWHRRAVETICDAEGEGEADEAWERKARRDSREDVVARIIWRDGEATLQELKAMRRVLAQELAAGEALMDHIESRILELEVGS